MATYDLEQQEQLDQVKHFWKQYGNLITWVLVIALGAYAAWTGYLYWQQKRSIAATGLYEELDRAAASGNADRVLQIFADLKGKKVGVTTVGSLTDWLARRMSILQGWGPDGIKIVTVQGDALDRPAIVAAIDEAGFEVVG